MLHLPAAGLVFKAMAPGLVDTIGISTITFVSGSSADLRNAKFRFDSSVVTLQLDALEGGDMFFDSLNSMTPIARYGFQWHALLNKKYVWIGEKGIAGYSTDQAANSAKILKYLQPWTCPPNLVVNSDFTLWTDPTVPNGWTKDGTHNATNYVQQNPVGQLRMVSDGSFVGIKQSILTIGKTYAVTVVTRAIANPALVILMGPATDVILTIGTKISVIVAGSVDLVIKRDFTSGAADVTVDSVSVQEIA